jgi:hypothetical protein
MYAQWQDGRARDNVDLDEDIEPDLAAPWLHEIVSVVVRHELFDSVQALVISCRASSEPAKIQEILEAINPLHANLRKLSLIDYGRSLDDYMPSNYRPDVDNSRIEHPLDPVLTCLRLVGSGGEVDILEAFVGMLPCFPRLKDAEVSGQTLSCYSRVVTAPSDPLPLERLRIARFASPDASVYSFLSSTHLRPRDLSISIGPNHGLGTDHPRADRILEVLADSPMLTAAQRVRLTVWDYIGLTSVDVQLLHQLRARLAACGIEFFWDMVPVD